MTSNRLSFLLLVNFLEWGKKVDYVKEIHEGPIKRIQFGNIYLCYFIPLEI